MSGYYDSKGLRHSSEGGRDSANREYLSEERDAREKQSEYFSEERDAREKQTDLLQEQASIQAEQLRLAEERGGEQRAHNKRVEALALEQAALAREEAARAQAQREFTKDVEWLERSDAKGRFDYLLRKRHSDIVASLGGLVFAKSSLEQTPIAPQRRSGLTSALTDFCAASLAYSNSASELDRIEKGLTSAKEAKGIGCTGCSAVFGVWLLLGCVQIMIGNYHLFFKVLALVLFGGGGLALYEGAKQAKAQKELTSLKGPVQERLETLKNERLQKRDSARIAYGAWYKENVAALMAAVQNAIRDGFVSERLKALIGEIELEFPPLLRVDWSALDSGFLAGSANELADDILQFAIGRHVRPDLLVVQLKVSGEEQLSAKLQSNPSLLAEVAGGN